MPKDRREDRHNNPGRLFRPAPPDLWDQLGDVVGPRERSSFLSELIRRYLAGEPMPAKKNPPSTEDGVDR